MEHDLLSEDDFFEQLKKEKRKTEETSKKAPEEPEASSNAEEPYETDLFEMQKEEAESPETLKTPPEQEEKQEEEISADIGEEPPIKPHPFEEESFTNYEEDIFDQELSAKAEMPEENRDEEILTEPEVEPEDKPKPKIYVPEDKIEDEKLPGLSKKPVIIWSIVILLLIIGAIFLYSFFSGRKGTEETAVVKESAQPSEATSKPAEDPMVLKQKAFLGKIANENNQSLSLIGNIISGAEKNKVQIASLLFYGDELTAELFGKKRADIARALMVLRNKLKNVEIKVVSTDERPGDGISSVLSFTYQKGGAGGTEVNAKLNSVSEAQQWLRMLANQFSVKLINFKAFTSKPSQFNLNEQRFQFKINGSYENCNRFLSALGQSGRNIKLYKLVFTSLDQKSFSKSRYQADVIAELYY